MIDKPGKYKISFEEYIADPCTEPSLTRTTIKSLIEEPARKTFLQHPRLNPQVVEKQSEKFDIGTAAHAIFLTAEDIIVMIDALDWRTNKAKEERDAAREAGKVPLLSHQCRDVLLMVQEAHKALVEWEGRGLKISDGDSEMTYVWQEPNGVWCRVRPDWRFTKRGYDDGKSELNLCLDYKTTGQSADPQEYNRIAIAHGHDIQDAFYRRGVQAVEGCEPDFVFMVQETEPPYLCAFMELDMMARDMGKQKVSAGIKAWAYHLETGEWPGYCSRTYTIEAPPWALAAWELRKFTLGGDNGI